MDLRVILNGKKAGEEAVREAIYGARKMAPVEVRVTWEQGDVYRFVEEAVADGCPRLVVGGGDGTVNEIAAAMAKFPAEERPELAILPLGTANDFATACGIPATAREALTLAQNGKATAVDAARANEHVFINVASGGFGAEVTANTPTELKNFLGGGAYTLSGVVQALSFTPYRGRMKIPGDIALEGEVIVAAVCNGRQAGGGQQLAPFAVINDGLLDVVGLRHFTPQMLPSVIKEISDPSISGDHVVRLQVPWVEWQSEVDMPINLDGEPITTRKVLFEVMPGAIKLVLPEHSAVLSH